MRRHDLDWVSLIAGLVFTVLALGYLLVAVTDLSIDGRFVWPVVLVALGGAAWPPRSAPISARSSSSPRGCLQTTRSGFGPAPDGAGIP
ncbi:MAG: hypothetical protein U0R70_19115 [Solirubrobacteraceae bacterium]